MRLHSDSRKKIENFYRAEWQKHRLRRGCSVGWSTRGGQLLRFEVLEKIGPLNRCSLLDVGSGLGDFYDFLSRRQENFNYTGIDVVEEYVNEAARRYPGEVFKHLELADVSEKYDYVFASGALNTKIPDHREFNFSIIRRMFELARVGVGFNMLNVRQHANDDKYSAYEPEEVLAYCRTLTTRVALIQGYLSWDFTIFMYH